MKTVTNVLYRIPTITNFDGKESFAFINPRLVSTIAPEEITIGRESPFAEKITGSRVTSSKESFLTKLTVLEIAEKLNIELNGLESEASA